MKTFSKDLTQKKNSTVNGNSTPIKKVNILMVDDHPENLLALEAVLTSPNYNLVSVTSGKEALKYMLKQDFAVILLDVQMPGLNGFEIAKIIKGREKTKDIPIIFITAISQDVEHVQHGYSVGAIDYIFKPFQPETLKQKIEQFVRIHQKHQEKMIQNELERTFELKEVNQKLDRATFDLRRSEALTQAISETLMDTIVTFNEQGYILSVNPAATKMFGYTDDDLFGQHVVKLFLNVKGDKGKGSPYLLFSLIEEAVGRVVESVALRKDETRFPADIQVVEVTVEGQRIFVCTIRDITERKEMEEVKKQQFNNLEHLVSERTLDLEFANERLQKEITERKKMADFLFTSNERFRTIFESSPSLIAIYSLKEDILIDMNTSWVNATEYSYDELKNEKLGVLNIVEELSGDLVELDLPVRNLKVSYITKGGEVRAGLLSTEMIDVHLEPCALIVLTDITETVVLEKEIFRLDRLNLIGEMAAGIAHEIRNPMTTVHGFLQLVRNDRDELPIEIIDLMLQELNRANSIITEFLTLAKDKVSNKKMQNLNTIIENLFPLIQAEALRCSKHAIINLKPCPDLLLDQKEIRQIILNIALNGLDAMSSSGELSIKTYTDEQNVVLEVKDQGVGIRPEVLEKMGTPFFTTKEEGTGLGLAICYSVAKRHHADIHIDTGEKGTIFSVCFKRIECK
ncbi:response regulator [Alkalihalobacillus deserti]|uniref:response regulator n=1 Tax=Alkalihalobacillus deserti TaxID=2879466 RepID=UPI001D138CFC|nr:response regulator [Alkalihalobacillus deserti]